MTYEDVLLKHGFKQAGVDSKRPEIEYWFPTDEVSTMAFSGPPPVLKIYGEDSEEVVHLKSPYELDEMLSVVMTMQG